MHPLSLVSGETCLCSGQRTGKSSLSVPGILATREPRHAAEGPRTGTGDITSDALT